MPRRQVIINNALVHSLLFYPTRNTLRRHLLIRIKKLSEVRKYGDYNFTRRDFCSRAHHPLLLLSWLRNVRLFSQCLFYTLNMTEALCCISVDIDAVAGWLGSYGGEDSTSDISRGAQLLGIPGRLVS